MGQRALLMVLMFMVAGTTAAADPDQQRQALRNMGEQAMTEFLEKRPDLRGKIDQSAGYAAFESVGVQVAFFGGGGGRGIVVDRTTNREHYMRMAQASVGIGLGIKDLRIIFIFNNVESLNRFVYGGWEFGGEAEAAAKSVDKGGSASSAHVADRGIEVYTLTKAGVSATATLGGSKYWKDGSLN